MAFSQKAKKVQQDSHQRADFLRQLIQAGYGDNALLMLNILAVDLGTLLP